MARYEKGNETRNKILQAAGRVFYQNGYKEAKLDTIAREAGVPTGLINYYFKKKAIIGLYYTKYINYVRHRVLPQVLIGCGTVTEVNKLVSFNYIFYNSIMRDAKTRKLYTEIVEDDVLQEDFISLMGEYYRFALLENGIVLSDTVLRWLMLSDYGAKKTMLGRDEFFNELSKYGFADMDYISFVSTIALRLAGLNQENMENYLATMKEKLNSTIVTFEMIEDYVIETA